MIEFDKRPYDNIDEMDREIMKDVMKTLKPGDDFYFLGDFALCHPAKIESFMSTLASSGANLFFIKGNHDHKPTVKLYEKYGTYLGEQKKIIVHYKNKPQDIILNHFCLYTFNRMHHGSWHLFAHSHHSLPIFTDSLKLDVGYNGYYKLLSLEDVGEMMSKKTFKAIDHHE